MTSSTPRPASAVDAAADRYVETACRLDPLLATYLGAAGHDDEVTDLSPAGVDERAEAARGVLRELDALEPGDDVDRVTVAAMRERIGLELEIHDAGLGYGDLNVIASPPQSVREVFDLMPTATEQDWATLARRMSLVPGALAGYVEGLHRARALGHAPPRRQVEEVATQ